MAHIVFYIKRLHNNAGKWLYINLFGMVIISFFESMSIYLLIPMLSLIGMFNMNVDSIPMISGLFEGLQGKLNLAVILIIYGVLIIGQALLQRNQAILNIKIQQGFIRFLRMETYQALLQANWSFFLRKRKSDFNHILTSELARVSQGTHLALRLVTSVLFTAIQIAFAFWISSQLTALVLISGVLLLIFSRRFIRNAKTIGDITTELSQSYFTGVTEHFNGIKDIKTNRLEDVHLSWFRSLCYRMEHNLVQLTRLQSTTQFIYRTALVILIVLFVYLSIEVFKVRTEQLMLIVVIFSRLWPRLTDIQNSLEQIASTIPAFKSLLDLQQECSAAKEHVAGHREPYVIHEGMACRNIQFRYGPHDSAYALRNVNIYIPANRMTAIVGKSGAGKSTLIDILIGLIKPEKGEVVIDGVPLNEGDLHALRSSVSYVSQDPFLFHSSIRENLLLVEPNAGEEQIWAALEFSASSEFVRSLPQGLDTIIGDRGVRLSGGERQRLVLARAMLRKPSILVLDEATSALDNENEAIIREAMERLKGSMTIIVIAHRLSTIRNADQVIVMEKGEVIQQGKYQQLAREAKGTFGQLLAYQTEAKR